MSTSSSPGPAETPQFCAGDGAGAGKGKGQGTGQRTGSRRAGKEQSPGHGRGGAGQGQGAGQGKGRAGKGKGQGQWQGPGRGRDRGGTIVPTAPPRPDREGSCEPDGVGAPGAITEPLWVPLPSPPRYTECSESRT